MSQPDEVACPSCGYPVGPSSLMRWVELEEDSEHLLAGTLSFLASNPLAVRCANCGTSFRAFSGFAFAHGRRRFMAAFAPSMEPPAELAGRALWASDVATAQDAIRNHLHTVTSDVVLACTRLLAEGPAAVDLDAELPKPLVTVACVLTRAPPEAVAVLETFVVWRAMSVVVQTLGAGGDPLPNLDAQLQASAMPDGACRRLLGLAVAEEGTLYDSFSAAFALAWFHDRMRQPLPVETQAAWVANLLVVLERWSAEGRELPVDTAFLKRTVQPELVWEVLTNQQADPGRFAQLVAVAVDAGLLSGIELTRFYGFVGTPEERRARATQTADQLGTESTAEALALLDAHGLVDEAEALVLRRLADLVGARNGPRAVSRAMRVLSDAARPQRALDLYERFWKARQAAASGPLAADDAIFLLRETGVALRLIGSPASAIAWYKRAEERLPESRDPEAQEALLCRQMAVSARDLGLFTLTTTYARRGLELTSDPGMRGDLLATLASGLMYQGDFEDALHALQDAVRFSDRETFADPETTAGQLTQLAQAYLLLGQDEAAMDAARRAAALAASTRSESLRRIFVTASSTALMATAAARLERPDADALLDAAEAAGDEGASLSAAAPAWAETSVLVRAQVSALRDDVAAIEATIRDTPRLAMELTGLLAEAHLRRQRWQDGQEALERAWGLALKYVTQQVAGEGDPVGALRASVELRAWTGEVAMHKLERGTDDGFVAAELQSSVVAGLRSWPHEKRQAACDLLADGSSLLAALGSDIVVVAAVRGRDRGALVCAGPRGREVLATSDNAELERLQQELLAVTRRGHPRGSPLDLSPRWRRFASAVGEALTRHVTAGVARVVFATGTTLPGLPLHMVPVGDRELCARVACSYTASLLQLAALLDADGRSPRSVGVVSVPRGRDRDDAARAFAAGAENCVRIARAHGATVRMLTDADADPSAVGTLLNEVDLAYLACHGLARPGEGMHALLLAAEGRLPPMLVGATGRRHLLQWDALAAPTPRVVLSAACSSGSASIAPGGERLALDRALLASGTRLFAGPLWDVAIDDAQSLMGALLARGLAGDNWGEAWRETVAEARGAVAPASWGSFTLVGAWSP
jgi:tetratricopeptide (TPR) repeat protein